MIRVENVTKSFTLHNQAGARIPVMENATLTVRSGECVGLFGRSGVGKSTLLRMIYGNYLVEQGRILIGDVDVAHAAPRDVLELRCTTLGYVSQFLRVIPRVAIRDVVAEPLLALGVDRDAARARAEALLDQVNLPRALWDLSPTTFSGGEQQRVNIARGFVHGYPALLLDEPTASLDPTNRDVVVDLILAAKANGVAMIGIFHDDAVRAQVCDRVIDVSDFAPQVLA